MPLKTVTLTYSEALQADLPTAHRALCEAARAATALAYAPYSRFRVGCAARLEGVGAFVTAANLENAAYPQCICAEAGLLAQARHRFPGVAIRQLAVAVEGEGATAEGAGPCGSCRQQLFEAEARQGGQPIELTLVGGDGRVRIIERCGDLLPLGFRF